MQINKLSATFGKLDGDTLELHEGLNIICAPNESGKSTWCAFIRAMLYGVDSSERQRNGHLPDKTRYAPWSGAAMQGTMELSAGGKDICLIRKTKQSSAPMREFSATYTGSSVPVEGLNGSNAGEMLTGVSKDVFRRSAFVEQGTVAVTGSPELEKRISAIVSTGEEQTSYSEADERLRQWQRKRRYNRRGMLPELEAKMDETQRRLRLMDGSMQDMENLEAQLESTRQRCQQLEQQVTDSRKRQRREALDRLGAGRAETEKCSAAHDQAMEELAARREELRGSRFGMRPVHEVEEQVNRDLDTLNGLKADAGRKPRILMPLAFFLLGWLLWQRKRNPNKWPGIFVIQIKKLDLTETWSSAFFTILKAALGETRTRYGWLRPIASYELAHTMVQQLQECPCRCQISALCIEPVIARVSQRRAAAPDLRGGYGLPAGHLL